MHIFGYPADVPALAKLAADHGVPVLEDACQAPGALDGEGRRVGTTGNPASFAFYANKQMTTGEGGILSRPTPRWPSGCAASATRAATPTCRWWTTRPSASTTG